MKLLIVAILFVGLAVAEESFLVRHKRVSSGCFKTAFRCDKNCESRKTQLLCEVGENPFYIFLFLTFN
jgi:hypothetical protein